jgi:hypothetical protein
MRIWYLLEMQSVSVRAKFSVIVLDIANIMVEEDVRNCILRSSFAQLSVLEL